MGDLINLGEYRFAFVCVGVGVGIRTVSWPQYQKAQLASLIKRHSHSCPLYNYKNTEYQQRAWNSSTIGLGARSPIAFPPWQASVSILTNRYVLPPCKVTLCPCNAQSHSDCRLLLHLVVLLCLSLPRCHSLRVCLTGILDVSYNFLTGSVNVFEQLGDSASALTKVLLHHNDLTGLVPFSLCESALQVSSDCNDQIQCDCCTECIIGSGR